MIHPSSRSDQAQKKEKPQKKYTKRQHLFCKKIGVEGYDDQGITLGGEGSVFQGNRPEHQKSQG